MSHAATNWAIQQRGLKPATKIVLWHLADCHNGHTGQCNPRQAVLAERCEMSRASINRHLDELERRGLIRRHQEVDEETKRQRPTHYILAFDHDLGASEPPETPPENAAEEPENPVSQNETRTQDVEIKTQDVVVPCLKSGHGKQPDPCLKMNKSRVSKSAKAVSQNETHNRTLELEPGIRTRNTVSSEIDKSISPETATRPKPGGGSGLKIFDQCRAYLVDHGVSDRRARSLVAKWRKEVGETEMLEAFLQADRLDVSDPVAWLTERLKPYDPLGWKKHLNAALGFDLDEALARLEAKRETMQ